MTSYYHYHHCVYKLLSRIKLESLSAPTALQNMLTCTALYCKPQEGAGSLETLLQGAGSAGGGAL